jgi:hypothetical protein
MYQTKLDLTNKCIYPSTLSKILFNDSSYMQTKICELREKNKCIIAGTHYQDQVQ